MKKFSNIRQDLVFSVKLQFKFQTFSTLCNIFVRVLVILVVVVVVVTGVKQSQLLVPRLKSGQDKTRQDIYFSILT